MTRKHIIYSLFGVMASMMALTLTGCAEEDFRFDEPDTNGRGVTLSFSCNDMLPQYIDPVASRSRAADPKTEEEKKINSLHLFFFDSDGNFVRPNLDDTQFFPYQYIPNATNLVTVGDQVFQTMTGVTVVAIANINATDGENPYFCTEWTTDGDIRKDSRKAEGERWEIRNYSDLKQWIYHPRLRMDENRSVVDLPSAGMPMIGTLEGASLVQSATNPRLEVQLKALMARVNITIKLNPNQESRDGALPTMTITSYGIKNMPNTVPFTAPTAAPLADAPSTMPQNDRYDLTRGDDGDDSNGQEMVQDFLYELPAPVTINKNSAPVTFSYYTYENIQLPDYTATRPGVDGTDANFFPDYNGGVVDNSTIRYPDGIDEADRQRWKPLMARKDASAMVLNASYVTHQELRYQARFTIYMGQNPDNDFQVKRNHAYNNNISIRGLDYVRNSSDGVYTFDARVNVVSDNPIYFAIVNERKIDAHASLLPMDVWFLLREETEEGGEATQDWESTVTLTLTDPEGKEPTPDWIRMEMIPREVMQYNGDRNRPTSKQFMPGTGARPYFTTNLLDELSSEIIIDGNRDKSRSRVYFYIDEYLPPSNNPAPGTYEGRYATVYVTYKRMDKNGTLLDERHRTLEIEQMPMVHIVGTQSERNIDTWMEYYEEYLEHNDPLDRHEPSAEYYKDGLIWGQNKNYGNYQRRGIPPFHWYNSDFDTINEIYNTEQAFNMTKYIIRTDGTPLNSVLLYNETVPASAFHYCYGKNKRNADGSVNTSDNVTTGWYMPGISELELALTQKYLDFPDFQGNFYWSCAAAKTGTQGVTTQQYEVTDRARATKVIFDNKGNADYAKSGSLNDSENYTTQNDIYGRALRSEKFRIRAFYKVQ